MLARLMLVGDIHLGRRPTGLGAALAELGLDPRDLSPAAAWARAVDEAIARRVAAVILAGDVVEGERDRFEAYAHLERGVARLAAQGIAVLGVAGNHDGVVLPRLAERIAPFRLVGAGGRWACAPIAPDVPIDVLGWSFPERHVRRSPLDGSLAAALADRRDGAALIGVLHADLDAVDSPYAPVRRDALAAVPTDAWFVGHVHRPDDLGGERPIGYLGSLVGLDAGEPGPRGPWLVEVEGPGRVRATQLPLGPIRWEAVDVDVSDVVGVDALQARVHEALREHDVDGARLVAARARLIGRARDRAAIRELAALPTSARIFPVGGIHWVVEGVVDATRPEVDLARLAEQPTPVGLLARRLIALEAGDPDAERWIAGLTDDRARYRSGGWGEVERPLPPGRDVAIAAGRRLLDALLAQQGARG